ncbi:hypothetical protein PCANC_05720 [Puccinia coronata f. sp. avenae]|uniref:Uncharacterized protein n=1 Tax=Puccinia coronata f. sp. avenae TaxID=200324 RepID=A0A2N5VB64_9BASI|nr:hypothetical protein PCASD_09100 [Puccinia coronata f. sp. avenae]PLW47211.1 hypothetical protein PCASD_02328 [Puccinia coronata f. sp. avenae]PLW52895.1 hypothetical protein PCANC_05720 [Puccinia coronata f. sp. avenae]
MRHHSAADGGWDLVKLDIREFYTSGEKVYKKGNHLSIIASHQLHINNNIISSAKVSAVKIRTDRISTLTKKLSKLSQDRIRLISRNLLEK